MLKKLIYGSNLYIYIYIYIYKISEALKWVTV